VKIREADPGGSVSNIFRQAAACVGVDLGQGEWRSKNCDNWV
jgi:hypothetical protein